MKDKSTIWLIGGLILAAIILLYPVIGYFIAYFVIHQNRQPTMYVQARNDPWTELSDIQSFYHNTPDNPKEFFWIENTKHRFDTYVYFQEKPEKMIGWLARWV